MREFFIQHMPFLGTYKRAAVALRDSLRPRASYSQHGEDARIIEILRQFRLPEIVYVDVGANHPTDISNTYLLYRQGHAGIAIEPNLDLVRLFGIFRPRDVALPVGCGDTNTVSRFTISKTPVLSSFGSSTQVAESWKTTLAPILTLDTILRDLHLPWLPLLSVDAEGLSIAALKGASETLRMTYLVCVEAEAGKPEDDTVRQLLAAAGFSVVERCGCNLIALNSDVGRFNEFRVTVGS